MSKKTISTLLHSIRHKLPCVPGAVALVCLALLAWTGTAAAQLPIPASTQFDLTGFLQEATLDTPADAHSGGTLKVNGHLVIVPRETIVILPANSLTWQELFLKAPAPWGIPGLTPGAAGFNLGVAGPTTGMAATDCAIAPGTSGCTAPPITTFEVHVVGNRVADQYIAGLIDIAQNGLTPVRASSISSTIPLARSASAE